MKYDLVIVGAGISGLTAALEASRQGLHNVLLLEHQKHVGGFTRLYMEDESFADEKKVLEQAAGLAYPVWLQATVVGFFPGEGEHELFVQTPAETVSVKARAVLIASGAMEKPREAHRIAGTRPAGVMTPSFAAELLARELLPGSRIKLFSGSRLTQAAYGLLLKHELEPEVFDAERTEVARIEGTARLEALELRRDGAEATERVECDTLIWAKGRYPSTFFLKGTELERDSHLAVVTDEDGRTSVPGVYAAGSCTIHGDDEHRSSIELAGRAVRSLLNDM